MLFSSTYKRTVRARDVTSDFTTIAEWLGITADELEISGSGSLKEITVYTCIKILSETLGKLPKKIYRDQGGKKKAADHYLYKLLKLRPNPYMSAVDYDKCLEVQRNINGNSYAWMEMPRTGRNAGKITGFYPLDSSRMRVYVDDIGLLSSKNSVWYVYTDNLGNKYKIQPDELLHFKGLSLNGIVGLSTIEQLRLTIENAKSSSTFLNNSYKKGMQIPGLVQYVGDLSEPAKKVFRDNFEVMANGLANANRIALMPIGYKYEPIQLKLTDAQFLENTKLTIQQLTAAFGIKLHQVNYLEKSSYASTSEANREFYVDTLMAILKTYEDEYTYKCFTDTELDKEGLYVKYNADVIMRGDTAARYTAYGTAIDKGFKTPNEIRELEEDEPKEGGDDLYMNGAMIRLKDVERKDGGKNND